MDNLEIEIEKLAQRMYELYCESVGNRSYKGDTLLKTEIFFNNDSTLLQANAWRNIASDVLYNMKLCINKN